MAALAIAGLWFASQRPTYLPPPGDELDILLELAGVFPDSYGIQWREHGMLRSTDPEARIDASPLRDALFMHTLTTGDSQSDGNVSIEVEYRFYAKDHRIHPDAAMVEAGAPKLGKSFADQAVFTCSCDAPERSSTRCQGLLGFGNYEFSLTAAYNHQQCNAQVDPKRLEEFRHTIQTADRLIGFYLQPLRRKSGWL